MERPVQRYDKFSEKDQTGNILEMFISFDYNRTLIPEMRVSLDIRVQRGGP